MKMLAGVCLGVALGVFAADAVWADCEDEIRRLEAMVGDIKDNHKQTAAKMKLQEARKSLQGGDEEQCMADVEAAQRNMQSDMQR